MSGYSAPKLVVRDASEAGGSFFKDAEAFIAEFLNDSATVLVHTSGSTGKPKPFQAEKARMAASARMTCGYLGLTPGMTNLLAMPLAYIAGKMVVVRSIVCGLTLVVVRPSSNPFRAYVDGERAAGREPEPIDLVAVTPMQAQGILDDPETAALFLKSRAVIIGGGAVSEELLRRLQPAEGAVYSSYGMTETLSHIALRRLTGPHPETGYRPLSGVTLSTLEKGTLVIDAPHVAEHPLVTNDIVRFLPDGTFLVRGRLDNVINSGAIKIQIEEAEAKLAHVIPGRFAISSRPSQTLGEEVVLVLEGTEEDLARLDKQAVIGALGKYEKPRAWIAAPVLPLTQTNKPDRPAIRAIAAKVPRLPGDLP